MQSLQETTWSSTRCVGGLLVCKPLWHNAFAWDQETQAHTQSLHCAQQGQSVCPCMHGCALWLCTVAVHFAWCGCGLLKLGLSHGLRSLRYMCQAAVQAAGVLC